MFGSREHVFWNVLQIIFGYSQNLKSTFYIGVSHITYCRFLVLLLVYYTCYLNYENCCDQLPGRRLEYSFPNIRVHRRSKVPRSSLMSAGPAGMYAFSKIVRRTSGLNVDLGESVI